MKTKSEKLFEEFCDHKGLCLKKISEGQKKTSDYYVYGKELKFIAEIKQIDMNNEHKKAIREFNNTGSIIVSDTPGSRVRKKITKAATQLKKTSKGEVPGIVVLYNNLPSVLGDHLGPYFIRAGMFGYETIILTNPKNVGLNAKMVDRKFGPKRKLTESMNTTVSGVAVLKDKQDLEMNFYHNPFAKCPLNEGLLQKYGVHEFRLGDKRRLFLQQWDSVNS